MTKKEVYNSKTPLAASAAIALVAAVMYFIRVIFDLTNRTVNPVSNALEPKMTDIFVFGALPALLVAAFAVLAIARLKGGFKPFVAALPSCGMAVYMLVLMFVNASPAGGVVASHDASAAQQAADPVSATGSFVGILLELLSIALLLLCACGIPKTKVAAIVVNSMSALLYACSFALSIYIYLRQTPLSECYGYLTAMAGMALYFVSQLLFAVSLKRRSLSAPIENPAAE